MNTVEIKARLVATAMQFDLKASKRRGYNPWAIAQYLERIDLVCAEITLGTKVRDALLNGFNDRLLTAMLKAVGEPDFTPGESINAAFIYPK